ncbi:helix-turn-helix transcriptional regulator [Conexibacter sp. SYSU D00693]|uniref:helix-turn-helix transcriptional regulator n=1 Tax=Conexibacter sp. SYSU D00693 TaxID=2812560 RepID=UPI00196A6DBB|nr:helix-turn-helix transcriptional regulator [Conexibacter sp. SYSU D00693]
MATFEQHRTSTVQRRRELFAQVCSVLDDRLDESELSVEEVGREVFASRRQVQRVMEDHGTTFRDELTGRRMERAADLLRDTPMTVRAIAHRVGYRQPAQFAKAFRRHHGAGPSAFRDAQRTTAWAVAA